MVAGVTLNWPCDWVAGAEPLKVTVRLGFEALEVIARLPLKLPEDWGSKRMLKVALCPAVRVKGRFNPLVLNPPPETPTWVTVILDPPVFVKVSDCVLLVAACTLPKLTLAGEAERAPGDGLCVPWAAGLAVLSPWQPVSTASASRSAPEIQPRSACVRTSLVPLVSMNC